MTCNEIKKYIFDNNKVEYVLENLGCHSIEFHPTENQYMAAFPDGDNKAGVVIKNNTKLNFYSYSRGINVEENRDIIYLVQKIKKYTFAEAVRYLHNLFGLKYTFNKNKANEPEKKKYDPLEIFKKNCSKGRYRNVLDFDYTALNESDLYEFVPMIHIDMFREGIIAKTIKKFGLMYSYKYKRSIFLHRYWMSGEVIGWNGRSSIENCEELGVPKYFITPHMPKSINLYGLWENYKNIEEKKYITVFEAEKSVLKRDSLGDETCVALSGHSMSDEQVRIILGLDIQEIVIALDNDVPEEEVWNICEKFFRCRKVSYIYDRHDLLGEKDSPADAVDRVYQFLFKYRTVYDEKHHKRYLNSLKSKYKKIS